MLSLTSLLPVAGLLFAGANAAPTPATTVAKRAVWLPAQGGCWSDNVGGERALHYRAGTYGDLTPDKCQSLCEAAGFNLAGTEFSNECWCGNTVVGNNRPTSASSCSNPCTGDANQMCGGADALSLYVKDSYPFTVGPASVIGSYNGYSLTQCWQDDNGSNHLLTGSPSQSISGDSMTVQKCIDGCQAAGFSAAGLEYARECYCGNPTFPVGQSTDLSQCSMPCTGDASQFCGGSRRMLIYSNPNMAPSNPTNPTTPGGTWSPAQGGCWSDNVDHVRALEHSAGNSDDMTIEKCLNLCDAQGFNLGGVEFGRECFCGNTIMGNNRPTSSNSCNMACAGSTAQTCGGADAINIYVKNNYPYTVGPATAIDAYNGFSRDQCYYDDPSDRLFTGSPSPAIVGDLMTVQKCIDGCAAAGFTNAGVEYGKECYCGSPSTITRQQAPLIDCSMPCNGDASEYCGGPNRILVYKKPTTPTPPTTTTARGIIQVINKNNNAVLGYISKHPVNGGYRFQPSEADAVHVTFTTNVGATSVSSAEIKTEDSDITAYSFLGLVSAVENADDYLQPNSYHWTHFAGTNTVASGSTPQNVGNSYSQANGQQRNSESHTWNINLSTGAISLTWVNPDGANAVIEYWVHDTNLYTGGDRAKFQTRHTGPSTLVNLKFLARP